MSQTSSIRYRGSRHRPNRRLNRSKMSSSSSSDQPRDPQEIYRKNRQVRRRRRRNSTSSVTQVVQSTRSTRRKRRRSSSGSPKVRVYVGRGNSSSSSSPADEEICCNLPVQKIRGDVGQTCAQSDVNGNFVTLKGRERMEGCDFHPGSGLLGTADPRNNRLVLDNFRYLSPYVVGQYSQYRDLQSAYTNSLNDPNAFDSGVTIYILPGCYKLPEDMTQVSKSNKIPAKVHFQGVSRSNANVQLYGETCSAGNKSWHGVCFMEDPCDGGNYRLDNRANYKKHPDITDRFCKCELSQNFRFITRHMLIFNSCLFDYGNLTRTMNEDENGIIETFDGTGAIRIQGSRIEVCRLSTGPTNFIFLNSDSEKGANDTIIKDTSASLVKGGKSPFYYIRLEGSQPLFIDGYHHVNISVNDDTTLIGSPDFQECINLCVTHSLFSGSDHGTLMANLWTNMVESTEREVNPILFLSCRVTKIQAARYDPFPEDEKCCYVSNKHKGKGKEPMAEGPPGDLSNSLIWKDCHFQPPKGSIGPGMLINLDQRSRSRFELTLHGNYVLANSKQPFIRIVEGARDEANPTNFEVIMTGTTYRNVSDNPPWLEANMRAGSTLTFSADETNGRVNTDGKQYEKLSQTGDIVLALNPIAKDMV